jgi:hypothetical protein
LTHQATGGTGIGGPEVTGSVRIPRLAFGLALLVVILMTALVGAGDWVIETVDAPKMFSDMRDRSLRLDAAGNPHVAYGGEHLYYAWYDGSTWQYETVDSSRAVGVHASLALDQAETPHIAYYDEFVGGLKHAHHDGASWIIDGVDGGQNVGKYTSIAVDTTSRVHISYTDSANFQVKYAWRQNEVWHVEVVDSGGGSTSLALGTGGEAYVGYGAGGLLRYAYRDASGWHTETADSNGGVYVSLVLDSSGHPHLSHYAMPWVRYAHRDTHGWHSEFVGYLGPGWNGHTSLALDSAGWPHISSVQNYEPFFRVYYAHKDSSGWHSESVPVSGDHFRWTSLALDAADRPHVSFYDELGDRLRWAWLSPGTGWQHEVVDSAGTAGYYSALALDSGGAPHVAQVWGEGRRGIWYTHADASGWHSEPVAAGYFNWRYHWVGTSLDVGPDDSAHISYDRYHYPYGTSIYYLREDPSGWHSEYVALGQYSALRVDPWGVPHVAYYDNGSDDLVYASRGAAGWSFETADSSGNAGGWPSLAIGGDGFPRVSYVLGSYAADELRYACRDPLGWHVETADSAAQFGWTSLALDHLGRPHISYHDDTNGNLKYAYRDAVGWHIEIVAAGGSVGSRSWIALGAGDQPHIAYTDDTNGDLTYAWKDGGGWHIETVDSLGAVGYFPSLAIDQYGRPQISYRDATNGDLKYARGEPSWMYLSGTVQTGQLRLTWNPWPNTAAYWVYGASNLTYFTPDLAPGYQHRLAVLSPLFQTWSSPNGIGDPTDNWTYLVLAVDASDQELCRSNQVGEWDFAVEDPRDLNARDWPVIR